MPFVFNYGVRIHYRIEGTGHPLVLVHGFGGSLEQFYFMGWVEALRSRYRVTSMDVRGHGQSDKPHDPEAYRTELLVGDFTAVLDSLGLEKAHYFGYSMGGEIGYGVSRYAPRRVSSLILGGANAQDPDPAHPSPGSERMIALLQSGREAAIAWFREKFAEEVRMSRRPSVLEGILPQRVKLISECDPEALIAMVRMQWQKEQLKISEILPGLDVPCLVFAGEEDSVCEGQKAVCALIPRGRFVSFKGLSHIETAARVYLVLPHVLEFLDEVEGSAASGTVRTRSAPSGGNSAAHGWIS